MPKHGNARPNASLLNLWAFAGSDDDGQASSISCELFQVRVFPVRCNWLASVDAKTRYIELGSSGERLLRKF
jgi:hypothetical protein